ncbi:hypothetical protein AGMMS50268_39920 [Spirochaetia bacterium]|nr:hypothetical protein AGMMS50268_39920 [Spirochaetia bacterium]
MMKKIIFMAFLVICVLSSCVIREPLPKPDTNKSSADLDLLVYASNGSLIVYNADNSDSKKKEKKR